MHRLPAPAAPLALRVAAPAARPYAWRLTGAGALVLVQVALVLAKPWPLALAIDRALARDAPALSLPLLGLVGRHRSTSSSVARTGSSSRPWSAATRA